MLYPVFLDAAEPSAIDMLLYSPLPIYIGIIIVLAALFFIIRALKKRK